MFRIKICGVTNPSDAVFAAECGADALGLNFYPKSKRYLTPTAAAEIVAELKSLTRPPLLIGVFVNEATSNILAIAEQAKLDVVQLHGDEPPSQLTELAATKTVKAFRCKNNIRPAIEWLDQARMQSASPDSVLLDAYHPSEYGGTGETIDLRKIRDSVAELAAMHWVLAGGLRPENVASAIQEISPSAVDTASGVESAPGEKCHSKMESFIKRAMDAFASLENKT